MSELWRRCLERLEGEFGAEDIHTYLKPLQAEEVEDGLRLWAPNAYTVERIEIEFMPRIRAVLAHVQGRPVPVRIEVGTRVVRRTTAAPVAPPHGAGGHAGPAGQAEGGAGTQGAGPC